MIGGIVDVTYQIDSTLSSLPLSHIFMLGVMRYFSEISLSFHFLEFGHICYSKPSSSNGHASNLIYLKKLWDVLGANGKATFPELNKYKVEILEESYSYQNKNK